MRHVFRNSLFLVAALLLIGMSRLATFAQNTAAPTPTAQAPSTTTETTTGTGGAVSASGGYTVQNGDTLDGIAANFDVQVDCLAKSNALKKPSELKAGQTLVIDMNCPLYDGFDFVKNPRAERAAQASAAGQGGGAGGTEVPPQPGPNDQSYTVKRGDTLDTIGQQFNVSVQSLMNANNMNARKHTLMPYMTLVIPGGAPPYGQFPPATLDATAQASGQGGGGVQAGPNDQTYVVQPGNTLDGIGAKFDTQVACIAQTNNLAKRESIFPGLSLVISASCPRYDGYDTVTTPRGSAPAAAPATNIPSATSIPAGGISTPTPETFGGANPAPTSTPSSSG